MRNQENDEVAFENLLTYINYQQQLRLLRLIKVKRFHRNIEEQQFWSDCVYVMSVRAIGLKMWCFRTCMSSHKKGTSHDTSFAVTGSLRVLSCFVCLVKVPLHILRQGHSLPVGCLSRSLLALRLVYPRCEPLAWSLNKFPVCAGDKRRKIAPTGAHWSLFQNQREPLFVHTYHWKQTKEA